MPLVVFDLVPVNGYLDFRDGDWDRARSQLAEFQPASRVELVGNPPNAIRVHAYGVSAEVAPAILARVCELAGCELDVTALAGDDPQPGDHATPPPGII